MQTTLTLFKMIKRKCYTQIFIALLLKSSKYSKIYRLISLLAFTLIQSKELIVDTTGPRCFAPIKRLIRLTEVTKFLKS